MTIVKRCMPSTSDGEVFKLSILIFLLEKIVEILPIRPIEFSVYRVMVYSCFSIAIKINLISDGFQIRMCLVQPSEIHCFPFLPLPPAGMRHRDQAWSVMRCADPSVQQYAGLRYNSLLPRQRNRDW